jgi:putative heme-binding domain-containing protein
LVNTYVGPDGALYVVDFYRQIIEGPEFMSEDVLKKVNLYNGTGTGRIYRISAKDAASPEWTKGLKLGDATDEQLVEKLADKNIWWRNNAQRLLVDRNSEKIVPSLKKLAQDAGSSMGRLHALWTLQGMKQLTPDLIQGALKDGLAGIRENAIQLAELHLDKDPALVTTLLTLQDDTDAKVRFQPKVNEVRQHLLFKDITDRWVQIAALSAASSQSVALLNAVLSKYDSSVSAYNSLVQLLSGIIGKSQNTAVIEQFLQKAVKSANTEKSTWQAPVIEGIAQGLGNRTTLPADIGTERSLLITASLENASRHIRSGALHVLQVIGLPAGSQINTAMSKALQIAENESLSPDMRASSIDFMALGNPGANASFLKKMINPKNPLPVQLSALKALGAIPGEDITKYLLQQWTSLSPDSRNEAINTFISSGPRVKLLLDALESGVVKQAEISWPQSVRLRSGGQYMDRARTLLTRQDEKRKDVIEQYQPVLTLKGNKEKGMSVYQMNCAMCHQVRGKFGRSFGPDLGTVHAWSTEDIMTNILDPNKSIAHGFDMWNVKLSNGKTVQGVISSETPTAITLSNTEGLVTNVARQDIVSLTALGMSAMPNNLESKIEKQQMADLIAFLKQED